MTGIKYLIKEAARPGFIRRLLRDVASEIKDLQAFPTSVPIGGRVLKAVDRLKHPSTGTPSFRQAAMDSKSPMSDLSGPIALNSRREDLYGEALRDLQRKERLISTGFIPPAEAQDASTREYLARRAKRERSRFLNQAQ